MRVTIRLVMILALIMGLFLKTPVFAAGYEAPNVGARALGLGNAVVATAGEPAALAFNPAALIGTENHLFTINPSLFINDQTFQPLFDPGQGRFPPEETTSDRAQVNGFYAYATTFGTDWAAFGVALYNPYSFHSIYREIGQQRYAWTHTDFDVMSLTPGVAFKVHKMVSIGLSLSGLSAKGQFRKRVDLSPYITPISVDDPGTVRDQKRKDMASAADSRFRFNGAGTGFTGQIGVQVFPHENWAVGASYSPGTKLTLAGRGAQLRRWDITSYSYTIYPEDHIYGSHEGELEMPVPATARAGVFWKASKLLNVELDVKWTGWSAFRNMEFVYDHPLATGPSYPNLPPFPQDTAVPRYWKDTYGVSAGFEYAAFERTVFRLGYAFQSSAIPVDTQDVMILDANSHTISFGAKLKASDHFAVEWAYAHVFYGDRTSTHTALPDNQYTPLGDETANGIYKNAIEILTIGFSYKL